MNVSNLESTRNCTFYYIEYFDANSCMNRTQSSSVILGCFSKMCLRVGYFFISNQEYLDNFTCHIKKKLQIEIHRDSQVELHHDECEFQDRPYTRIGYPNLDS